MLAWTWIIQISNPTYGSTTGKFPIMGSMMMGMVRGWVGTTSLIDRTFKGDANFLSRGDQIESTSIVHLQHRTPPHSTSSGYVDDVYGYDFAGYCSKTDPTTGLCLQCAGQSMPYGDSSVNPEFAHGTHVAGLVGAVQNNQQGVTGTAPRVQLMVLRVRDV